MELLYVVRLLSKTERSIILTRRVGHTRGTCANMGVEWITSSWPEKPYKELE